MGKSDHGFLNFSDSEIHVIHLRGEAEGRRTEEKGACLTDGGEQDVLADWSMPRERSLSAKS